MPAVSVSGVSKRYRIFPNGRDRLKEALSFGRKKYGHDFWALQDIDLEVEPGTALGILGPNGAGKSTLLSIISGILQPTSGTVEVNGRLVALLGLGALGFNPEFTGRENILLNGLILGIDRKEMLEHFDDIADFADIGEFMDQPIKNYSTGMRSRLGFAVAVNVKPDILILDETFASGDEAYKQAALQKMHELRDSGMTTLFVSHSMSMIEDFCTKAVLLRKGRIITTGGTTEVINRYQALVSDSGEGKKRRQIDDAQGPNDIVVSEQAPEDAPFKEDPDFGRRAARFRSGTGEARIRGVELLDERFHPVEAVASGSAVTVRVYLEYLEAVQDSELVIALREKVVSEHPEKHTQDQFYGPNLGYVLELYERYKQDPASVDDRMREFFETWSPPQLETNGHASAATGALFSTSTALEGIPLKEMDKGERVVVDFTFEVPLHRGRYTISAGVRARGEDSYLDRVDVATTLRIKRSRGQRPFGGRVYLPTQIKVRLPEGEWQGRSA